jgi:hypothetical protein
MANGPCRHQGGLYMPLALITEAGAAGVECRVWVLAVSKRRGVKLPRTIFFSNPGVLAKDGKANRNSRRR